MKKWKKVRRNKAPAIMLYFLSQAKSDWLRNDVTCVCILQNPWVITEDQTRKEISTKEYLRVVCGAKLVSA